MSNLMNSVMYLLIFAGGFLVHKFFLRIESVKDPRAGQIGNLILAGLFILVGIMLFMFQDDLKEDVSLVMISLLGYVGLAVKDAFPQQDGNGDKS